MHLSKRLVSQQYGKSQWILLNTLTGAVDVIDKDGHEHLRKIKEGDFSTANGDFVKILKKRGYLFENESEEDNLLKKMFATQKKKDFWGPN